MALSTDCSFGGEVMMARKSSRWKVKNGGVEVAVAVLAKEILLVMGCVENGCADGCMRCSSWSRRMLFGDATSWAGLVVTPNGIRRNRKTRGEAGCMSWRLYHSSEPRRLFKPYSYLATMIENVALRKIVGGVEVG